MTRRQQPTNLGLVLAAGLIYLIGLLLVLALLMSMGGDGGYFALAAAAGSAVALFDRLRTSASIVGLLCLLYVGGFCAWATYRVMRHADFGALAVVVAVADVVVLTDFGNKLCARADACDCERHR